MKTHLILFILVLSSISCSKKESYGVVFACFDAKIKENTTVSSVEYFKAWKSVENQLIKEKILFGTTQSDYIKLTDTLFSNQIPQVKKIINDSMFYEFNPSMIALYYKYCHMNIKTSDPKLIAEINNKLALFDALELNGFESPKPYIDFINATDFNNKKERLLLLFIICPLAD